MGLFDRFKTKPNEPSDAPLRKQLVDFVIGSLTSKDGRVRVEDAISASATIVAERCIDLAGEYPLRDHEFTPGSHVFSDKINTLICGDQTALEETPADSVVGMLRDRLDSAVYPASAFPDLGEIFKTFASGIGSVEWGRVPLSVGQDHLPFVLPLRVGYESRSIVDQMLASIREDRVRCLSVATGSLADLLMMVASAIDRKLALVLALETINGMAKTAPMTEKAMKAAQESP